MNIDFSAGTNARIEEPHVQVNRKLNPRAYEIWKDSVKKSIAELGTPLLYDQTFNVTYSLPLQYIPVLDWMGGSISYNATYNWERGPFVGRNIKTGNSIKNQRQMNLQGSMNFLSFYNKNRQLRRINQKYGSATESSRRAQESRSQRKQKRKFETTVQLNPDSGTIVSHGLMIRKFTRIVARRTDDSTLYKIDYKPIDYGRIRINNRDSVELQLTMYPAPPREETPAYKALEYTTRFLMMTRRVNVQYGLSDGMHIPGFSPMIGDWIGQANTAFGNAPGWGFAFGDVRESYIREAANNNWLVMDANNIRPARINSSKTLTANATLEPATGLKIDLNATRVDSRDTEISYMFEGMPTLYGGTFTMTTVAIGNAFANIGNASNGYESKTFREFLNHREVIASRLENEYAATTYPNAGFLANSSLANQPYNPEKGNVSPNSSDALIPAFLAAYTGKNPKKIELTAFPKALTSLLPNWRISYDGLIQIPLIKKHFKSMVLSHQYRCVYSVGAYQSYPKWVSAGSDHLGYIPDTRTEAPIPSSAYEITSVSITEGFNPLLGIDATFLNNVTAGMKYQKTRNLNLNVSSYQIVEAHSNELMVSLGYKYADFNKILKIRKKNDFNNDLTVRFDYARRKTQALIRKIADGYTQMTSGAMTQSLQFSADYAFSKSITLRAYYDLQINTPLVSSASYPTSNSDYGISIRLSLNQ